jgi:hypothetical protein
MEEPTITKSRKGVTSLEFNSSFGGVKGIVHHEFVLCNTTVNPDFYCGKDRNFSTTRTGSITTTCLPTCPCNPEFVTNSNVVTFPHPPYLPDLAPCYFALFPKLKVKLKGRHFEIVSSHPKGIASST